MNTPLKQLEVSKIEIIHLNQNLSDLKEQMKSGGVFGTAIISILTAVIIFKITK